MELTPENKAKFEAMLARYPVRRSALLPTLRLAQEQEGWISREAIEHIAQLLELTPAQVHDTASFYTMFRLKPAGKTTIEICTTLSCALGGSEELLHHTCRKLGIEPGGTTEDGKFTVREVECLAACGGAPAVQVNGEWLENATAGGPRPRAGRRDGAAQLRVAEEPGRARAVPERVEGELDLARGLPPGRRLREARRVAADGARGHHRGGQEVEPARPRRRRLPDRDEVELPPQGQPEAALPLRQRRRERARAPTRTA